jgi:hypothetical protein
MNAFCSLEDGLEELEENKTRYSDYYLFFSSNLLPVTGRRWKEIGRTRCRLSFEQHGRRGLSALPENLKKG